MFHDPLVCSPLLTSVTGVVAEPPGAVYQHLLGQDLQGARLKDKGGNSASGASRSHVYKDSVVTEIRLSCEFV